MTRKSLTPKEREDMWRNQGGMCRTCGEETPLRNMIAAHTTPVALGNDNKPDALDCQWCDDIITNGRKHTSYGSDKHAIAKSKRLLKKRLGEEKAKAKIHNRGFIGWRKFNKEVVWKDAKQNTES